MDLCHFFRAPLVLYCLTLGASGCAESPPTGGSPESAVLIHQVRNGSEWVNVAAPTTLLANSAMPNGSPPAVQAIAAEVVSLREKAVSAPPPAGGIFGTPPRYEPVPDLQDREKWRELTVPADTPREPATPVRVAAPAASAARVPAPVTAAPDRSTIAAGIIARSVARYSGNCPCPYNVDSAGRSCGARSAYSRPGGEAPICYADDVSDAMIAAFR